MIPASCTPPSGLRTRPEGIQSPEKFDLHLAGEPQSLRNGPSKEVCSPPSGADCGDEIMQQIWRDVESIKTDIATDHAESLSESDFGDEDYGPQKCSSTSAIIGFLPCGDVHVCRRGHYCPYLEPNDDRIMVCKYTGIDHGPEQTDEIFDLNGGNGKKSNDPDQNCGEFLHGKWVRRADPLIASRMAFDASERLFDNDFNFAYLADAAEPVTKVQKRGALCVGERPDSTSTSKRNKCSKKNVSSHNTCSHLQTEAEGIITKMIDHKLTSSFKNKTPRGKVQRKCIPPDPRMVDESYVFKTSVQAYVRNCSVVGTAPCLNDIHNLALIARTTSANAKQTRNSSLLTDNIRSAKFRRLCSSLAVSLWSAACASPYMSNARKGTDAYRPFVCGVLYAFKRGITLDNGMVIVPKCALLANALPVLRGTGGNTLAKTLHSSSHRGVCTLSRCIASVPQSKQAEVFEGVSRIAHQFTHSTFTKWDV